MQTILTSMLICWRTLNIQENGQIKVNTAFLLSLPHPNKVGKMHRIKSSSCDNSRGSVAWL